MLDCKECICNNCDYGYCRKNICSIHKCNKEQEIFKLAFPISNCEEYIDKSLSIFNRVKKYIANRFSKDKRVCKLD